MPFEKRVTLRGSERTPLAGARQIGQFDKQQAVHVTVILRRKSAHPQPDQTGRFRTMSHEDFAAAHGADPNDIDLVEQFAHAFGLTVIEKSQSKRTVGLAGSAGEMEDAFQAVLHCYETPDDKLQFRGRTGTITLPAELKDAVIAILGLDTRPVATPQIRRMKDAKVTTAVNLPAGSFTPTQVAQLYKYPTASNGQGQTIAILELGGGYRTADLNAYFAAIGISPGPNVTAVSVDGGKNTPGSDADGEVMLDIEVAGAVAPASNIAVYFAPNTDQGFVDAVTNAVHDTTRKPSIISISWGSSEDNWTDQARNAMNAALQDAAALGVTVTVAAGDNGSSDGAQDNGNHVDFPASSPYSLACGGTTLAGQNGSITSEVVWNETANNEGATGGGVSNYFALPDYQQNAGVPPQPDTNFVGRGVPDVAGDADPTTGYYVRVDGQDTVVGGTSAVAPLWAGLIALINQRRGTPVGFVNPQLYQNPNAFQDIIEGNNGTYSAGPGWDACTGLGSPNGTALTLALAGAAASTR